MSGIISPPGKAVPVYMAGIYAFTADVRKVAHVKIDALTISHSLPLPQSLHKLLFNS
jgi:hypothetical protein